MTTRRAFIAVLGGAAAWPVVTRGQQVERMRRIGVLMNFAAHDPEGPARLAAFLQGLQQLGWSEGRNVRVEIRWEANNPERSRTYAAELMALVPDVVLAAATPATAALLQASRTVPIVFAVVGDPVGSGFVGSLARPGGNATGFMNFEYGLSAKWLELLKQVAPRTLRAGILRDPTVSSAIGQLGALQSIAPSLAMEVVPIDVREVGEIERVVTSAVLAPGSGMIVLPGGLMAARRELGHRAGCSASPAHDLSLPLLRRRGWPHGLRTRSRRAVPPGGSLRRPHSQGREARRPAGASAD
jgi:putative ABC transport system substrate-binding protein